MDELRFVGFHVSESTAGRLSFASAALGRRQKDILAEAVLEWLVRHQEAIAAGSAARLAAWDRVMHGPETCGESRHEPEEHENERIEETQRE